MAEVAPDIDDLIENLGLNARLREALLVAYSRGERAGRKAAHAAILAAVSPEDDDDIRNDNVADLRPRLSTGAAMKAPRGLVTRAVKEVLSQTPGRPIIEIENLVTQRYPVIARKSVGNELRRQEGVEYRRVGKYNWFLIEGPESKSSAPEWNADDLLS